MRIIREGDLSRLSTVRRFVCSDCGCVFEASGCEYLRTTLGGKMIRSEARSCPPRPNRWYASAAARRAGR